MDSELDTHIFNISTPTDLTYTIPRLDIEPGPTIFTYISQLLSLITPSELPLNLVRDALYSNLTLIEFATNAIKIESGFIALMGVFVTLSLIPFCATLAWCCGRKESSTKTTDRQMDILMDLDNSLENVLHCRKRCSIFTLVIFFIILIFSDIVIFYANSRLASTVNMTPELVQSTVHDVEVFLKDTHLQIKEKLDSGFHLGIENFTRDLEDIDILLGEPIKMEVSASTGIELAYDSLNGINYANTELVNRVALLQDTVGRALKISQEASARMEELQIQLSVLQRQCTFRDRPLCDTLRIRSFEENGIIDALKTLQEDQSIFRMRYLGEIETGATTVRNLSTEVAVSKSLFGNYPLQVKHDTILQRNATLEQLEQIRHKAKANAHMLTHTIVSLLDRLTGTWESIEPHYEQIRIWSNSYWSFAWMTAMIIIWVIVFMLLTMCCFICNSNVKAAVLLVTGICFICLGSFAIMLFGVVTLAVGGNSEIFLCRPLFNDDQYRMLGKLFDKPGYFYSIEPENGIIGELLRPSEDYRSIVRVPLPKAISDCEDNMASFKVFQLDAFVNTTQVPDLRQFPKVNAAISAIRVSERNLLLLTQSIENILESMLVASDFNLTSYRTTISAPTPEKDLATFIDQMQRVALQIQDVATSSRMTTLASRAKRLQASILQPLEQLQNEIMYHLTALELQRDPWMRQVNQTLIHLRNIDNYLEKTAIEICRNQTKIYGKRLRGYLTPNKDSMTTHLGERTAICRPLFDIFDANRTFLCRNAVDFINALWFFTLISLFIWAIATPVGLNLITLHNKIKTVIRRKTTSSHISDSDNAEISEQSNWGTSTTSRNTRARSTRARSRRPPTTAPPPPPPHHHQSDLSSRQDSVRSVRWETEEFDFQDVEDPNPIYTLHDNLV